MTRIAWKALAIASLASFGGACDKGGKDEPADDTVDTTPDEPEETAETGSSGPNWQAFQTFGLFAYDFENDQARSYTVDTQDTAPTIGFILFSTDFIDGRANDEYCFMYVSGPSTADRAAWAAQPGPYYFGFDLDLTTPMVASNCDDLFGDGFTEAIVADFVQSGIWGLAVATEMAADTITNLTDNGEDPADFLGADFHSTIPNLPEEFYEGYATPNELDEGWSLAQNAAGDPIALPPDEAVVPQSTVDPVVDSDAAETDLPGEPIVVPAHIVNAVYQIDMTTLWVFQ